MLNEKNELRNRTMHISGKFEDINKQDIGREERDIDQNDVDQNRTLELSGRTKQNIEKLKKSIGRETIFGRRDVMGILGLTPSPASELIKKMLTSKIIEPVKGHGKGKYHFV